jgi:hypothetical protein
VRAEPVDHLLIACGLSIGIRTGAEYGNEQMRLFGGASGAAVNRDRRTCPVDEQLLARFVCLAQDDILFAAPALVELAEPAVAVAIRVGFPVFLPEQLQRYETLCLALLMDGRKVRRGPPRFADLSRLTAEKCGFHLRFLPAFGQRLPDTRLVSGNPPVTSSISPTKGPGIIKQKGQVLFHVVHGPAVYGRDLCRIFQITMRRYSIHLPSMG